MPFSSTVTRTLTLPRIPDAAARAGYSGCIADRITGLRRSLCCVTDVGAWIGRFRVDQATPCLHGSVGCAFACRSRLGSHRIPSFLLPPFLQHGEQLVFGIHYDWPWLRRCDAD